MVFFFHLHGIVRQSTWPVCILHLLGLVLALTLTSTICIERLQRDKETKRTFSSPPTCSEHMTFASDCSAKERLHFYASRTINE
jgi:hypothetical protein